MNKDEFLGILEKNLRMDEGEKSEVIRYYSEYIDEAGESSIDDILTQVGDPEKLAEKLSADYRRQQSAGSKADWEKIQQSFDDMMRDIGSSVENFVEKAFRSTDGFYEEDEEAAGGADEAKTRSAIEENAAAAGEAIKKAGHQTKKLLTSIRDIFKNSGAKQYAYINRNLEPFSDIDINVQNCPVYIIKSEDGRFGAEIKITTRDDSEAKVRVKDGVLKIESIQAAGYYSFGMGNVPRAIGLHGANEYIRVYLPENEYHDVRISTSNAKVEINGISEIFDRIFVNTSNSRISARNIIAKGDVELKTSNSAISFEESKAATAVLRTSNSSISISGGSAGSLNASTSNGAVRIKDFDISDIVNITTSNGPISIQLNCPVEDCSVSAKTSNADILVNNIRCGRIYENETGITRVIAVTSNSRIELTGTSHENEDNTGEQEEADLKDAAENGTASCEVGENAEQDEDITDESAGDAWQPSCETFEGTVIDS